jgi:hypothetical protein
MDMVKFIHERVQLGIDPVRSKSNVERDETTAGTFSTTVGTGMVDGFTAATAIAVEATGQSF